MLFLALLLILGALGFLIAAFVLGTQWAWPSIALSVLAAITLVIDWILRRRAAKKAEQEKAAEDEAADEASGEDEVPAETENELTVSGSTSGTIPEAENTTVIAAASDDDDDFDDSDVEPRQEETDAADLLVVYELDDEVLVVDERPRYHLRECTWLGSRDTIPVAVSEARELGFTPCARCGPDAVLAAKKRKKRKGGLFSKS